MSRTTHDSASCCWSSGQGLSVESNDGQLAETAAFAKGASQVTNAKLAWGRLLPSLKSLEGISHGSLCHVSDHFLLYRALAGPRSDGGRLTHLHIIPDGKFLPQYSRLGCCRHITARPRGREQVQLVTAIVRLSLPPPFSSRVT